MANTLAPSNLTLRPSLTNRAAKSASRSSLRSTIILPCRRMVPAIAQRKASARMDRVPMTPRPLLDQGCFIIASPPAAAIADSASASLKHSRATMLSSAPIARASGIEVRRCESIRSRSISSGVGTPAAPPSRISLADRGLQPQGAAWLDASLFLTAVPLIPKVDFRLSATSTASSVSTSTSSPSSHHHNGNRAPARRKSSAAAGGV